MTQVSLADAAKDLPSLIERARNGEAIVIVDGHEMVARLEPLAGPKKQRRPGSMQDTLTVPARLMEPLSDEELELVWGKENL